MTLKVGEIGVTKLPDNRGYAYSGQLRMPACVINFKLKRNQGDDGYRPSKDAPAYLIIDGSGNHVGNAWSKHSDEAGGDFFSLTFDDPHWEKPIYVSAFPRNGGAEFEMVWSRPRRDREQEAA